MLIPLRANQATLRDNLARILVKLLMDNPAPIQDNLERIPLPRPTDNPAPRIQCRRIMLSRLLLAIQVTLPNLWS